MSETNENFAGVISVDTAGVQMPTAVANPDTQVDHQITQTVQGPEPVVQPYVAAQPDVYVYIKETALVSCCNAQNPDEVIIDIYLGVSITDSGASEYTGKNGVVKKRLAFSKCKLAADMQTADMTTPVSIVEEKQEEKKVVAEEPKRSTAQRMRELAGIPHPKNWT